VWLLRRSDVSSVAKRPPVRLTQTPQTPAGMMLLPRREGSVRNPQSQTQTTELQLVP